jgi:hypothetical protein
MKTLITILLLSACLVQAQEKTEVHPIGVSGTKIYINTEKITPDTTENSICKERGHVRSEVYGVTLMNCVPQIVDLPDKTLRITHDRNIRTYHCQRCGKGFSEPVQAEPDTVIWKK